MNWFLTRSKGATEDRLIEERALHQGRPAEFSAAEPGQPPLVLLAMDARGTGCRRLHCFADAEAAKGFVKLWYPYRSYDGVNGYWLLRDEPLHEGKAEWGAHVLIMIRDSRPGLVYAFSKPSMDSAREFLAYEFDHGLDLADVMPFWVVPVQIENDFRGDTLLFPSTMPEGTTAGHTSVTALDERELASALALHR